MRRSPVRVPLLFLALAPFLALAAPGSAQPFHDAYFQGDPDNEITAVVRAEDGGFWAVGHFAGSGRLVKLGAKGGVDRVQGFGPIRPLAVRAARGGGAAWIGNRPDVGDPPYPLFVLSDAAGAPKLVYRVQVPGAQRAEIRALDVDPGDGSYWIGGNAWTGAERSQVWLAHLDAQGGRLAAVSFAGGPDLPQIRIDSLVVTPDHGAVAVGARLPGLLPAAPPALGADLVQSSPFALGVDPAGRLRWSRGYEERISRFPSRQWFVDAARDAGSTSPWVYVLGRGDSLCGTERALPCNALFTGAVVAQIDARTGAPGESIQIVPRDPRHAFEPAAIVRDEGRDGLAVGGRWDEGGSGLRHAVLARVGLGERWGVLGARRFGDGPGPFDSEVADLSPLRLPGSPAAEPGYIAAHRQGQGSLFRPTLVKTDAEGKADGKCEEAIPLDASPSTLLSFDIPLTPGEAHLETTSLTASPESLSTLACSRVQPAAGAAPPIP